MKCEIVTETNCNTAATASQLATGQFGIMIAGVLAGHLVRRNGPTMYDLSGNSSFPTHDCTMVVPLTGNLTLRFSDD